MTVLRYPFLVLIMHSNVNKTLILSLDDVNASVFLRN
jgi:hypothetical protein